MNHNKIVDIVHVVFIHIFIPSFLTDGLINIIILEVGSFYNNRGTLNTSVCDDGCKFCVGECLRYLGHYGFLTAVSIGFPKIPLQLLRRLG